MTDTNETQVEVTQCKARKCPFCRQMPLVEDGRNDRPWVVQCYNRECRVQPFVDDGDTKADAIAAWNGIHRIEAEKRTAPRQVVEALEDHFPFGLQQRLYEIATTHERVDGPITCTCHCGASFSGSDEHEVRHLWAEHAVLASLTTQNNAVAELPHPITGATLNTANPGGQAAAQRSQRNAGRTYPMNSGGKWRSRRDSNPRYGVTVYTLSRRAPSTTRPLLRMPARARARL